MEIQKRLSEIWSQDYINCLPSTIKDRGFCFGENIEQKDILITGFNPSFRENETEGNVSGNYSDAFYSEKYDNYISPMKKMIFDENIDLRPITAYTDLFYFREKEQNFLKSYLIPNVNGVKFMVDQLNVTQHIIEDVIRPKLIVVKNKESWSYFGKLFDEKGWVWMGYKFEFIQNLVCGELFKITGLLESSERIAPELTITNLVNSYVLFTQHINQYTKIEERPTPQILKTILDFYNLKKE